jgi:hypothetical protein
MARRRQIGRWSLVLCISGSIHILATGLLTAWLFPPAALPHITLVDVLGVPHVAPAPAPAPAPAEPPEVVDRSEPPPAPAIEPPALAAREPEIPSPAAEPSVPPPSASLEVQPPTEAAPELDGGLEPAAAATDAVDAAVDAEGEEVLLSLPEALASGDVAGTVDGSRIALLVRTARVSSSPQAREVRQVIRAVPGFDLYLGESAFDPLTDFAWMMVNTPDPRSLVRTTVVAGLAVERARARATIDRIAPPGSRMRWTSTAGTDLALAPRTADRRQRTLAWASVTDRGLVLIGPSRWVRETVAEPDRLTGNDPFTALSLVQLGGEEADLVLVADHLEIDVAGDGAGLPMTLVVAVWFGEPSTLAVRAWFESEDAAEDVTATLNDRLDELERHPLARLIDLPGLVSGLDVARERETVTATLSPTADETVRILRLAVLMLGGDRQPPSVGGPATGPAQETGRRSDPRPGSERIDTN